MTSSWRSDVSFSQRLTRILRIAQCIGDDSERPASEIARELETDLFDTSSTIDEYNQRCTELIAQLEQTESVSAAQEPIGGADSTDLAHVPDEGETLGEYSSVLHFKDGLFSTVYKARQVIKGETRLVALKVTTPSVMVAPHDSVREVRVLTACQEADNRVITLLDSFKQPQGRLVLVFPFMPLSFAEYLEAPQYRLTVAKTCLRDLFTALTFLHHHGVIHRDVKPSNILLSSPQGPAYLSDFGIAWSDNDHIGETADNKITDVGTTCYRAPELLFGNTAYTSALDLWAAGCVAAELMTPGRKSLFDPGPLGSELGLILSMFKSLGTPNEQTWPEASSFRDWGKMNFTVFEARPWAELLPDSDTQGQDFMASLLKYESGQRWTAEQALRHPFLRPDDR